jgi:Flp pilus assembly protein TadD
MLCLPLFGVWSWWLERRSRAGVRNAILGLVAGLVVLSPATLHNYRATGEWYLVQAVSGLTLRQGNGPGASGTITVVPGTSVDREELFRSARREAEATIGRDASWGEIDRHYRNEVLSYWVEDPLRAARLFTRKAYWFLTGRNHGDIYLPTVERSEGIPWRLHLMPLHTAWLIPPALLAIVVWARRPGTYLPELMLFAVPLAVVLLFRYSPRYRLPAIPVIVLGCAWALYQVVLARGQWRWPIAFGVLALSGIGLGVVNRAAGFDALDPLRPQFHHTLADACSNSDRPERALVHYREALELKPDFVQARANLGNLLVRLGQPEAAVEHLREAVRAAPDHAIYHDQLGRALLALDRSEEALGSFRTAVRLQPDHPGMRNNLANTLRGMGRDEEAFVQYRAALQADPTHVEAHFNLAGLLQARGDIDGARQHYSEALRLQPSLAIARQRLQLLEAQQGP